MPRTRKKKSDPVAAAAEAAPAKPAPTGAAPVATAPSDDDFDALFDQLAAQRKEKLATRTPASVPAPGMGPASASALALALASASVALAGELTIDRVAQIKTILQQGLAAAKAAHTPMRLDLSAVIECDGAGLQLLLALAKAARVANANIELQGTPPKIAAIFDSYGVAGHFTAAAREAAR